MRGDLEICKFLAIRCDTFYYELIYRFFDHSLIQLAENFTGTGPSVHHLKFNPALEGQGFHNVGMIWKFLRF